MEHPRITGTLVWYYFICKREVWLMSRQINPFEDNPFLEIARILHDDAYARERKEIQFENLKFDIVTRAGRKIIVGEIKKSSKFLKSAEMQLSFYLLRLEKRGLNVAGEILVPAEKKKMQVELTEERKKAVEEACEEIQNIISGEIPPKAVKSRYCSSCAYAEFCWS